MNKIVCGDCIEVMKGMEENSLEAVVCDPPYGLEFMGMKWDRLGNIGEGKSKTPTPAKSGQSFGERIGRVSYNASQNVRCRKCKHWKFSGTPCKCVSPDFPNLRSAQAQAMQEWHFAWAQEALRVAKPGAYLLAFGGTRTHHRLMCAIEDAGWILRDTCMFLHGQGFPKNTDVSKMLDHKAGVKRRVVGKNPTYRKDQKDAPSFSLQRNPVLTAPATPEAKRWDGFGTGLKPAWEPIILAQKPLEGALLSEIHSITGWRRWHTTVPKKVWTGKAEDEKSWKQSQCYKRCKKYGLEWWEKEADEGKVERWIFERRWLALEPKAYGRHVVVGKNKRMVLERIKYNDKAIINTAANVIKWGCGVLNIDACRIGMNGGVKKENIKAGSGGFHGKGFGYDGDIIPIGKGRWPANFLLSHTMFCEKVGERKAKGYVISRCKDGAKPFGGGARHPYESEKQSGQIEEIWRCVPDCPARMIDEQSGETVTRPHGGKGERLDTRGIGWGFRRMPSALSDRGGASRFFYTAKPSGREKKAGLSAEHNLFIQREEKKSDHPTIKSIALMRYLCRLATPPNGVVLDCFAGSGSTGCAAILEGFQFVGIEKELEYVEIMRSRIEYWAKQRRVS